MYYFKRQTDWSLDLFHPVSIHNPMIYLEFIPSTMQYWLNIPIICATITLSNNISTVQYSHTGINIAVMLYISTYTLIYNTLAFNTLIDPIFQNYYLETTVYCNIHIAYIIYISKTFISFFPSHHVLFLILKNDFLIGSEQDEGTQWDIKSNIYCSFVWHLHFLQGKTTICLY